MTFSNITPTSLEMVSIMNTIAKMNTELSDEERHVFATAYLVMCYYVNCNIYLLIKITLKSLSILVYLIGERYKHLTHTKRLSWKTIQTTELLLKERVKNTSGEKKEDQGVVKKNVSNEKKKEDQSTVKESNVLYVFLMSFVVVLSSLSPISFCSILFIIYHLYRSHLSLAVNRLVCKYRSKIEEEIRTICNSVFEMLDTCIAPFNASTEGKVFFIKMYVKMKHKQ